eukprot:scaffold87884_cov47-Cyclotella_meneghiniana.AAC.1
MKLALLLSILPLSSTAFYLPSSPTTIIASSITDSITTTSSRFSSSSSRLHYKTSHEYEYGNSDDRVVQRALLSTSEDRWNVLNVLENDVLLNHVGERPRISKRQQHESRASSSASSITSTQPNVSSNEVTWEVDADRFSLASLLEPPAAPYIKQDDHSTVSSTTSPLVMPTSSRIIATKTSTAITPLHSIQDYNHHILNNTNNSNNSKNQLKLIRFTAPWCQVCRSTHVAYERMVSKLSKHNSNNDIAFYSVSIDSNDPSDSKN